VDLLPVFYLMILKRPWFLVPYSIKAVLKNKKILGTSVRKNKKLEKVA